MTPSSVPGLTRADVLLTLGSWLTYLKLLMVSWPMNVAYMDMHVGITVLTMTGAVGLLFICYLARGKVAHRAGLLGLVWIVLFLLPVSGIVPLTSYHLHERFLYLPSVGLSIAVGGLLLWLFSRPVFSTRPARLAIWFVAAILVVLTFVPGILGYIDSIPVRLLASLLIAVFAFFFVTVSSRIVGLVGVTSNPTSGMTIATLLGTSVIFLAFGWTDSLGKASALMVGTAVCIAASIAGDTSQDLKTGFILGATPRRQQIGELVGVITSAGVVAYVVGVLHRTAEGGLGGEELPAPQGVLMKLIIDGVLEQKLPWTLILIGVGIGLAAMALRLPVLPFAVGVYLPLSTMGAVFLGGFLRWWLARGVDETESERRREKGVLFGSGLVGGAGLTGVLLAIWVFASGERIQGIPINLSGLGSTVETVVTQGLALLTLAAIAMLVWWRATAKE